MNIREFTKDDYYVYLELCNAFYNEGATKKQISVESKLKTFNEALKKEYVIGYIFCEDNIPVGYALVSWYWCNEECGLVLVIDEFFVSEQYRNMGYLKCFVEYIKKKWKNNANIILLEVLKTNEIAKKAYTNIGFKNDGFDTYELDI